MQTSRRLDFIFALFQHHPWMGTHDANARDAGCATELERKRNALIHAPNSPDASAFGQGSISSWLGREQPQSLLPMLPYPLLLMV